ncbi:MAG: hypothetical protein U0168_29580 [Nannocystaceae bacterium]|jgi:hypothetical protein
MHDENQTMQVMSDSELEAVDGAFWGQVLSALYIAVDEVMDFCKGYSSYQPSQEVVWSTITYQ